VISCGTDHQLQSVMIINTVNQVHKNLIDVSITGKASVNNITPVLMSLHWLPIDLRIEFKILIITYKTLHGLAPAYIEDLLVSYIPGRNLRSAKKNLLAVPGFKLNSYRRHSFSVAAPLLCDRNPHI